MIKFWKNEKYFDYTKNHDFLPSDDLIHESQEYAQNMSLVGQDDDEDDSDTFKMRQCKHDRLWKFTHGVSHHVISCCDCAYWRFI